MSLGIKDFPVSDQVDEALGFQPYVGALTEFIQQCQTPLTIAIQGDWGSGKTSLMQLIRAGLTPGKSIATVWINAWQLTQFDLAQHLPRVFLTKFATELRSDPALKDRLVGVLKAGVLTAAVVTGRGEGAEDVVRRIEESLIGAEADLREQLEKLVQAKKQRDGLDRVVVFIDDLDRLVPAKALELLEVLKVFLDIDHCVFVLACDYQVIVQGQRAKFGADADKLRGKSFFDKIIQLPFQMPVAHYDFHRYLSKLLDTIQVTFVPEDLKLYEKLLSHSIGFNPRSMKRVFNSMMLLMLVAKRSGVLVEDDRARLNEKHRIIFALLCLELRFEEAYRYIVRHQASLSHDFLTQLATAPSAVADPGLAAMLERLEEESEGAGRFTSFMDALIDSAQLRSDDQAEVLSSDEIATIQQLLKLSTVVATQTVMGSELEGDGQERNANRRFATDLCKALSADLEAAGIRQFNFKPWQARKGNGVTIWTPLRIHDRHLILDFARSNDSMHVDIRGAQADDRATATWFVQEYLHQILPDATATDQHRWLLRRVDLTGRSLEQQHDQFAITVRETLNQLLPQLVAAQATLSGVRLS